METSYALPLFAMQNIASGETASFSRLAPDVTMRSLDIVQSENSVDSKFTIGAIGMSKPESRTLNYMYYGYAVRREFETKIDGLSLDYVYPGCDGQMPGRNAFLGLDYKQKSKSFRRVNHPVEVGFEQQYSVALQFGHHRDFQPMMTDIWRATYNRMRDRLFEIDNERHYHNCMKLLTKYTRQYGDSYGLPFACQLPDMDISTVSFQFGFVGQQPGIGYQLLRMLADGIEAILDAYLYMRKKGEERPDWLEFCRKTADWLVNIQNEDGSLYRAYNTTLPAKSCKATITGCLGVLMWK